MNNLCLLKKKYRNSNINNFFIHVGKCGGLTINKYLIENNLNFNHIHIKKLNLIRKDDKFLICLRNPIKRFISAYYYSQSKIILDKLHSPNFPRKIMLMNQNKIFNKYKNVNNLINDLKINKNIVNGKRNIEPNYIQHVKEDINYYLGDILDNIKNEQIIGITCQETLNEDLKRIFNYELKTSKNINEQYKDPEYLTLTDENYKILKDYLKKDYEIIDKLYKRNLISEKQYEILSK